VEYENNRERYKTFRDFVPRLLSALDNVTVNDVRRGLGLPIEKYRVTVTVNVPNANDEVFLTGNQAALGNWDPKKVKMEKSSELSRTLTFESYPDLQMKLTKGGWEKEAYVQGVEKGENIQLKLGKDSTYHFQVNGWKE